MKKWLIGIILISIIGTVSAQETYTLSGYIKDKASGEELIGATIQVKDTTIGASSNIYGFYSLSLPEGGYTLVVSYIGYNSLELEVSLRENKTFDIELTTVSTEMEEVVVKAEKDDATLEDAGVGTTKINIKKLETLPVFMGEKDILKSIQLLPGISASSEGSTGLNVRGGKPDQNLILLDEAVVYNPSHFLGFFSVFNSDALKDLTIYKGGIPAQYGGRASSVLDIYMKNGNKRKFSLSGGLGLISSRLTFEGPIVKDKGSFIISGRATYLDLILRLVQPDQFGDLALGFWDLNVKANYSIGKKDRIYLSGYMGRDNFKFGDFGGLNYGNYTVTFRWNHTFNEKLFSNTSFFFSDYYYGYVIGRSGEQFTIEAGIRDFALKQDYSYYHSPKHTIRYGWNVTYHQFQPSQLRSDNSNINSLIADKKHATESGIYVGHEFQISDKIKAIYGLRFSLFNQFGPGDIYAFDQDNNITDTTNYNTLEHIQTYWGIEPRLALTYQVHPTTKLEFGYHRIHQYVHLLSNSTSLAPNDMWIPSTNIVKPQIADQVSLGVKQSFLKGKLSVGLEGYFKYLQNQVDYENGADILLNNKIESQILNGAGWSYGGELLVQANVGDFSGWLSYTLSKTQYQFDEINDGQPYSAKQDRTHDISLVGTYTLKKRWVFSIAWVYQTGNAVTFPSGKYEINGQKVSYFTERNGYRMPDAHRLDIAITFKNKPSKKFQSSFTLGVYNVYNRKNPYSISFRESSTNPGQTEAVQLSLFGIVPTITWNFSF